MADVFLGVQMRTFDGKVGQQLVRVERLGGKQRVIGCKICIFEGEGFKVVLILGDILLYFQFWGGVEFFIFFLEIFNVYQYVKGFNKFCNKEIGLVLIFLRFFKFL